MTSPGIFAIMAEKGAKPMKKIKIFLLVLLLAAALAFLFREPLTTLYEDITFNMTGHTETELEIKAYADAHGVSYSSYPGSLIALLERNPETRDFVLNYPFREALPANLTEYTREEVPLMLQWDMRWGYEKYGSDFLAITGCGPTCLAMVGYYLTGEETMTPDQVASFAEKNGYYSRGSGSSWTLISEGGPQLGLSVTELPLVRKKMVSALEEGKPIILSMGPGDFTSSGHYIVLTGMDGDNFRVCDPNSIQRSDRSWSYEELEDQIRNIWAISLP